MKQLGTLHSVIGLTCEHSYEAKIVKKEKLTPIVLHFALKILDFLSSSIRRRRSMAAASL